MKTTLLMLSLILTCPSALALPLVGKSKLRIMFWDIYTARLYAPQGQFTGIQPPLTLSLTYHRDIASGKLMEATREQWQKLNFLNPDSLAWLERVSSCFPDVSAGDKLSFKLMQGSQAEIEFNGELRCSLPPSEGNRQFLAIWLSDDSAYPRFTQRLLAKGE